MSSTIEKKPVGYLIDAVSGFILIASVAYCIASAAPSTNPLSPSNPAVVSKPPVASPLPSVPAKSGLFNNLARPQKKSPPSAAPPPSAEGSAIKSQSDEVKGIAWFFPSVTSNEAVPQKPPVPLVAQYEAPKQVTTVTVTVVASATVQPTEAVQEVKTLNREVQEKAVVEAALAPSLLEQDAEVSKLSQFLKTLGALQHEVAVEKENAHDSPAAVKVNVKADDNEEWETSALEKWKDRLFGSSQSASGVLRSSLKTSRDPTSSKPLDLESAVNDPEVLQMLVDLKTLACRGRSDVANVLSHIFENEGYACDGNLFSALKNDGRGESQDGESEETMFDRILEKAAKYKFQNPVMSLARLITENMVAQE
ncbi:hypothetical protein BC830DRAFT_1132139 [Chytriomyces sp. MP71]|nr:hypothetical protein BC830DRAFT_1132139 [Chytriomyces sp. MP71]